MSAARPRAGLSRCSRPINRGILMTVLWDPGWLTDRSAGLVIDRLRVRMPGGAAGEFSLSLSLSLSLSERVEGWV